MEIEETYQYLNKITQFEEIDHSKTNVQKYINGTLGREINIHNGEKSFLEL